eukprot:gene49696-66570_t
MSRPAGVSAMRAMVLGVLMLVTTPVMAETCAERIAFVRKVIDYDLKVNFIGKGVYEQMSSDMAAAEKACQAGDNGRANQIISATQSKHGYP